jgi:hypothetical protein
LDVLSAFERAAGSGWVRWSARETHPLLEGEGEKPILTPTLSLKERE